MVASFSDRSPDNMTDLTELVRYRACHQPDQCAYIFLKDGEAEAGSLTYRELDIRARNVAVRLQSLGTAGDRAVLMYPPGLDYIVAFFGCLYAGIIAVPVYPPHPARPERTLPRLLGIVRNAHPRIALTLAPILAAAQPLFSKIPGAENICWIATDDGADICVSEWQKPDIGEDTLAFLQYTSGSTGTPKGVMVSHENLLHNSALIHNSFQNKDNACAVIWLPPYHDMGLIGGIIQPLYRGFPAVIMSPAAFLQKPFRWLEAVSRYKGTVSGGPNFAYDLCIHKILPEQRDTLDLSSWEIAFNGSEPVRPETMDRFADAFRGCGFRKQAFYPCYGLAEATLFVSGGVKNELPVIRSFDGNALEQHRVIPVKETNKTARTLVGTGNIPPEQQAVIVKPGTLRRVPGDGVGEIWVSGKSMARGYWKKPEESRETFHACLSDTGEGPFLRTGDMGFVQEGELFVTGRLKDLIIIRGRNHYPQDIELTVEKSYPMMRQGCSAVFSVEAEGEERLIVAAEIERRHLERRQKEDKLQTDEDRRASERRQPEVDPWFSPDNRQPVNFDEAIRSVRKAVAEQHGLQVYAVLLLKPGTISKTSSGKIQRHACREAFFNKSLDVVGSDIQEIRVAPAEKSEAMVRDAVSKLGSAASPEEKQSLTEFYLKAMVAVVLRTDASRVDSEEPLTSMGIDSLISVELEHRIEADLGIVCPMIRFLEGPSIRQLAAEFAQKRSEVRGEGSEEKTSLPLPLTSHLSYNQKSLWFMYQLAPESSAYNVFFAVRIRNADISALQEAFHTLILRHPVLRTVYAMREGEPVQEIREDSEGWFTETDASAWTEEELAAHISKEAHHPFDLENGPVMRVCIFVRSGKEQVLLLNVHHIATDMWSLSVMMDELRKIYEGRVPVKDSRQVSLSDYVRWQEEMLAGHEGERLWNYWRKHLDGELPVLNLPTDRPRPPVQTYNGASHGFAIGKELTQKIKDVANASGATLYMTLLAVFQILLYRYTDQEDILVGSPAAGRSRYEFKDLLGYLVNPVVLRADLSGNPKFREFLGQVRQTVLDALSHQDYPFQLLVEKLQPERDVSRSPLFQVMCVLQRPHRIDIPPQFITRETGGVMTMGTLTLESLKPELPVAPFDLILVMAESDQGVTAALEYNTDLFDPETVERMAGHFLTLSQGIAEKPDQRVADLPLLTQAERHQLLVEFNDTYAEYPKDKCLHELFEEQVEKTPNATAVIYEDQQLTYRELNERANQLAAYLQGLDLKPESLIGIFMERSLDMIVSIMGILKTGCAYVPLNPVHSQDRLIFMLEDIRVLLTHEKLLTVLPKNKLHIISIDTEWDSIISAEKRTRQISRNISPEHLAYVIYTSGSTGKPKGVQIRHYSVLNLLTGLYQAIYAYHGDLQLRISLNGSLSFDTSVKQIIQLLHGHTINIIPESLQLDGKAMLSYLICCKIDVLDCTPSQLDLLISNGLLTNTEPYPKVVLIGGEPIDESTWFKLKQAKNITFYNVYGPTECTVDATICNIQTAHYKPIIGHPIANTKIYILDSRLHPVPVGVSGELYIGGDGLARGYLNDPKMTDEKFISDPFNAESVSSIYKTGDRCRYIKDGAIEFLGRNDNQIKLRGFRIELGEIESVLKKHPDVRDAVIMVSGDEQMIAYVVPVEEKSLAIRGRQRYRLPNNMAITYLNKNEADFLYREIFEIKAYLKHGITINDGDCIFDVGANIGLFALFAHFHSKNVKIYAFEPNPFVFEILRINTSLYGVKGKLFDCGLSGTTQTADFTFYPEFSIFSGCYSDKNEEKEIVKSFIRKQYEDQKGIEILYADQVIEELLTEKFKSKTFGVRLRTLSDVIEENNIEQIDLLKINVEKSEHEVLKGIGEENWKNIRQIAMEVHNIDGRFAQIKNLLEGHGYQISIEKDWSLEATADTNYYIYAIREPRDRIQSNILNTSSMNLPDTFLSVDMLRDFLKHKLPQYMIPSNFVILENLPLTFNGKIDRLALQRIHLKSGTIFYAAPQNEAEQRITEVWKEVLRLEKVGIHDNFFDIGGHSLLMVKVHSRLKEIFDPDLSIIEMLKYPTVAALAQYLTQESKEEPVFQQAQDIAGRQKEAMRRQKRLKKQAERVV